MFNAVLCYAERVRKGGEAGDEMMVEWTHKGTEIKKGRR
jgi:hypothetical protein